MSHVIMQAIAGTARTAAPIAAACLLACTLSGCGTTTSSTDVDTDDDIDIEDSTYDPHDSSVDSDKPFFDFDETDTDGITADDYTELDNGDLLYEGKDSTGYIDSDGYQYYKNSDGSLEVTDGYGNAVKDYDGDGEVDAVTNDSGATWTELN